MTIILSSRSEDKFDYDYFISFEFYSLITLTILFRLLDAKKLTCLSTDCDDTIDEKVAIHDEIGDDISSRREHDLIGGLVF